MKLTPEEFAQLKREISVAYPTLDRLKDLALSRGITLDSVVELPATTGRAAGDLIMSFDGDELIAFIEAAVQGKPQSRTLRSLGEILVSALKQRRPWYAPPIAHETCFVQNYLPFVNRTELRRHLSRFAGAQASSILIITGATKSGKSYSFRLAKFLRDAPNAAFNLASMDAVRDTDQGAELSPGRLLSRIGTDAGFELTKIEALTKNSRATTLMYEWLVKNTVKSRRELWIFLDGFGPKDAVPQTTRSLIDAIALNGWKSTPAIRLILIDYDSASLPGDSHLMAETEDIEPLKRKDVAAFFRSLYQHRGEEYQEEAIQAILEKIATVINLDGAIEMPLIHKAMSKVIRELFPEARV